MAGLLRLLAVVVDYFVVFVVGGLFDLVCALVWICYVVVCFAVWFMLMRVSWFLVLCCALVFRSVVLCILFGCCVCCFACWYEFVLLVMMIVIVIWWCWLLWLVVCFCVSLPKRFLCLIG